MVTKLGSLGIIHGFHFPDFPAPDGRLWHCFRQSAGECEYGQGAVIPVVDVMHFRDIQPEILHTTVQILPAMFPCNSIEGFVAGEYADLNRMQRGILAGMPNIKVPLPIVSVASSEQ